MKDVADGINAIAGNLRVEKELAEKRMKLINLYFLLLDVKIIYKLQLY